MVDCRRMQETERMICRIRLKHTQQRMGREESCQQVGRAGSPE